MKMTRRNFLSTSAVAALACGASLTAHAAGSTDENSLNFITDIFKDSPQPGEIEEATAITAEKNAEWYEKLDFSDRREFANAAGWTMRKVRSSTPRMANLHGICRATAI
mgnify:CR=1 FL=1